MMQHERGDEMRERTVYLLVTKVVLENLYECMSEIPSRCVNRLQGWVKHRRYRRGTTYYAARLVDDDEFSFNVVVNDFHGFSCNGGFMPMHDISGLNRALAT